MAADDEPVFSGSEEEGDEDVVSEDHESDDESEEEEEEKVTKKRKQPAKGKAKTPRAKRARPSGRNFLDVEAAVGDDDEDDDYGDDDFLGEADEAHAAERQMDMTHRRMNHATAFPAAAAAGGGAGHLASAIGNLERRFQDQGYDELDDEQGEEGGEEYGMDYGDYGMEGNDPSRFIADATDAKLWVVKVNRTVPEREVVVSIMNKANQMRAKGIDFPIASAFAADGVKGHIYVEAEHKGMVQGALEGLRSINLKAGIRMVPVREMCSVFLMGEKETKTLLRGDWVRVKSGVYSGDLGQVADFDTQTSVATIRLVPRVDFNEAIDRFKSGDKKKPVADKSKRPVPRFFEREDIEAKGADCEQGPSRGTFRFDGKLFEETGYILRKVRAHLLATDEDARPTPSEVKEFSTGRLGEGNEGIDISRLPAPAARRDAYSTGEVVSIQNGDLTGLKGTIVAIEAKTVLVQPVGSRLRSTVSVPLTDVVKFFDVGTSVRVVEGQHKGNTGLITSVDFKKKSAMMFSPALGRPVTCGLEELQSCGNFGKGSGGINQLGGFAVGDLVQLSGQESGVIVRIDSAKTLSVLTAEGKLENVALSRIATKRSSDFSTTLDHDQSQFGVKASVTLLDAPYKGQTGRVIHIWKQRVFVKLPTKDDNHGIIVVDSRQLKVSGADSAFNAFSLSNHSSSPGGPGGGGPPGGNRGRGGGRGGFRGGRGRGGRGEGQRLKIISGRNKGCLADVLSFDDMAGTVRCRLLMNGTTQSLQREQVAIISANGRPFGDRGGRGGHRGGGGGRGDYHNNNNNRNDSGSQPPQSWDSYFGQDTKSNSSAGGGWGAPSGGAAAGGGGGWGSGGDSWGAGTSNNANSAPAETSGWGGAADAWGASAAGASSGGWGQ